MPSIPQPPTSVNNLLNAKRPGNFGVLPTLYYDVETYLEHFCICYCLEDAQGKIVDHGTVVDDVSHLHDLITPVLRGEYRLVGFNNWEFDDRILSFLMQYVERNNRFPAPQTMHKLGNLIISGRNLDYEAKKERDEILKGYGVKPFGTYAFSGMSDDVRLSMGTRTPSLKVLESRLGMANIEETPVPFDKVGLTPEDIVGLQKYCLWDVKATRDLYKKMREQCDSFGAMAQDLEVEIAEILSVDPEDVEGVLEGYIHPTKESQNALDWLGIYNLRSLPQSQFAEKYCRIQAFLAHFRATGELDPFVVLPPTDHDVLAHPRTEKFTIDPSIPLPKHWQIRRWVNEGLSTLKFVAHERGSRGGKPQMHVGVTKAHTADAILMDNVLYRVGVGGIHSVDPPGIITPKDSEILVDLDVTSFYPALIVNLDIAPYPWPEHLQKAFSENYKSLMDQRIALKGKIKKAEGSEKKRFEALAYAYKIVLNSVYGKFRDRYSILWSPSNQPAVTLHGQVFLLWCIERTLDLGGKVVSANTDGFTILATPEVKQTLMEESQKVGYILEETEFKRIVRESISCYAAQKLDGEIKRKGAMETKPSLTAEVKRPVVYDAVIAFLTDGVPVEDTIDQAIYDQQWARFAMMRKTSSKTTYHITCPMNEKVGAGDQGKVFRYLWAKPEWRDAQGYGNYRLEKVGVESPKYGDEWDIMPARSWKQIDPEGIDVDRYIAKAWEIIGKIMPPSLDPTYLPEHPVEGWSPKGLWDIGLYPAANRGKIVLSGKRYSSIQPWASATTLGCYTGPKYNRTLVIDVDDPEQFKKFLAYEKGKRKDKTEEFILPDNAFDTAFSQKKGLEGLVLDLTAKGKLVFAVPDADEFSSVVFLETLPPTAFNTKTRSKLEGGAGFDIFWGQGGSHPALVGARDDGGIYEFHTQTVDAIQEIPLWLWQKIESHFLPSDRERVQIKQSTFVDGEFEVEDATDAAFLSERYGLDSAPSREDGGIDFSESISETIAASHRGATWITDLLAKAIDCAHKGIYPNTDPGIRSHYAIPGFSPHCVEIVCWGGHATTRGGKTVVALVEDRDTQEPRIIYKCFGSSCQSEHSTWREAIQVEFDRIMEDRRKGVLERFREEDFDGGDEGDGGSPTDPVDPTDPEPSGDAQEAPTGDLEPFGDDPLPQLANVEQFLRYRPKLDDLNPVAKWLLGPHVVGAFHQPMGSGKGYGSAQVAVENLIRGNLTLYVAPRNAQLYGFRTELMARMIQYRQQIEARLGDISALTGAKFNNVARLGDMAFAQEIVDKLVVIVNAENHVDEIKLSTQMIILTNPYYLGQKGDTGKAHPFSYQLGDYSIKVGRQGLIIFDEYQDIVREAWSKTMPVKVRYRRIHSQAQFGMIPKVISHCPAKPSGWSQKASGGCDGCHSCHAPASLRSNHGVLTWKELTMASAFGDEEEHPFQEAENAPMIELGETGEWVSISRGKTQSYAQVHTVKLGGNVNWDDRWTEGEIGTGWAVNARRWIDEKPKEMSDNERKKSVYSRNKEALSYNLRANFGVRAVMDTPVLVSTDSPIMDEEVLRETIDKDGLGAIRFPRNACLSPQLQWIDATAWYRMMDFIATGWRVRFLSATVSQEALDHVQILADGVAKSYNLPEACEFSLEHRESPENVKLEEVLVIGSGLSIGRVMEVISNRRNTQLLSVASDETGEIVPSRIAAFFGRQRESEYFFERNASRVDFHPWWGLHQSSSMNLQTAISQSAQDVSESLWMLGGERRGMEHPHIMSYLYGSLSTGANIRNLRTLIVDYSTPPPLRAHLSNYRNVDEEGLRQDHAKAFGDIIAQVAGRALRFKTSGNRAIILICGVDSHAEFQDVVAALPLQDRAQSVASRYMSDPNTLMPVMYKFLNRLKDAPKEESPVVPTPPVKIIESSPRFDMPVEPKAPASMEPAQRVRHACERVHEALREKIPWLAFKDVHKLYLLESEDLAKVKHVWDEVKSSMLVT